MSTYYETTRATEQIRAVLIYPPRKRKRGQLRRSHVVGVSAESCLDEMARIVMNTKAVRIEIGTDANVWYWCRSKDRP